MLNIIHGIVPWETGLDSSIVLQLYATKVSKERVASKAVRNKNLHV